MAVSEQKLIVADLTVKDPHSIPRSIEISPNGHKMAIVSSQGLTLWDTLDAEPSRADFFPASEVLHTLWQNDSKTLFAVIQPPESNSNSIARVDTEQRIISSPPTPNDVYCLFPCPAHSAPGIVTCRSCFCSRQSPSQKHFGSTIPATHTLGGHPVIRRGCH